MDVSVAAPLNTHRAQPAGTMDRVSPDLPPIPDKRYFTIGEVSELCLVKPYVLRYWEQEFAQLRPTKRSGNRRYYQLHDVQLVRCIRELLYIKGFTISGARNRLLEMGQFSRHDDVGLAADSPDAMDAPNDARSPVHVPAVLLNVPSSSGAMASRALSASSPAMAEAAWSGPDLDAVALSRLPPEAVGPFREALLSIRDLLS